MGNKQTNDKDIKPRKSSGRRASKGFPNPIDMHVGMRVRNRRTLLGLSQVKLGEAIGLTFQQVQKYETGANRIGSSRLFDIANVLDVPIAYFYEEMSAKVSGQSPARLMNVADDELSEIAGFPKDPMARRETLEFVRCFRRLPEDQKRRIGNLIRALAKTGTIEP